MIDKIESMVDRISHPGKGYREKDVGSLKERVWNRLVCLGVGAKGRKVHAAWEEGQVVLGSSSVVPSEIGNLQKI